MCDTNAGFNWSALHFAQLAVEVFFDNRTGRSFCCFNSLMTFIGNVPLRSNPFLSKQTFMIIKRT